jgi:hypothetical protein
MTDSDYIKTYIHFLENIDEIGRRSLRWLRLTVSGDSKHHFPETGKAMKRWELISDCINLSTLDVFAEIDYFYRDQQTKLKLYMTTDGSPINNTWPKVLRSLQNLRHLKHLVLRPVFCSRWRYFEVAVSGKLSQSPYTVYKDLTRVRFRVRCPVEEAGRLSDQVKGCVRKGLRGFIRVRVLTTETWEHYGADVILGRLSGTSEDWGDTAYGAL